MILGSPFFSDFDGDSYSPFYSPLSYAQQQQQQQQQRRAMERQEESRRRAALERYYRMKAMEDAEEERRRQLKEYERRLLQQRAISLDDEQRRRRNALMALPVLEDEEDMYRNQLLHERAVKEAERQDRMRALRFLSSGEIEDDDEDHNSESDDATTSDYKEEPVYQLMRGPDGRIYRVQVGVQRVPIPHPQQPAYKKATPQLRERRRTVEKESHTLPIKTRSPPAATEFVNGSPMDEDDAEKALLEQSTPLPDKVPTSNTNLKPSSKMTTTTTRNANDNVAASPAGTKKKKKKKTRRIRVVVEDASESETEDEFYNSPWRNRRPAPGKWLEPVEFFEGGSSSNSSSSTPVMHR
jgi:hypothetical protein